MYLGDITSTHEGYEARVEYQHPWMVGRLMIAPSIGVSRLDKSLVDYYYGVRINEATASRPYFKGRATSNTYFDIAVVYMLSDSLEWLGGVNYMLLGKNIEASPIVEQGHNVNAFTALMYKF
jgi:outer membrane protein